MTSYLISAAAAPILLALVPCVFSNVKTSATSIAQFVNQPARKVETAVVEVRAPWWKPQALGIDNYS